VINRILRLATALVCVVLIGCSAAMVPDTSDPWKKLQNASYLIDDDRAIPAQRLAKEALADFEAANNAEGVAQAHMVLGNFYKSKTYRNHAGFYKKHNEYDPTLRTSIEHFAKAAETYRTLGDNWGVSTALFGMGNAEHVDGNQQRGCELYKEALDLYLSTANDPNRKVHWWNPKFESYDRMIQAFTQKYCQSK